MKSASLVATETVVQWQKNAKARLEEIFSKTSNRILSRYAPPLAGRNQVFDNLRRNQINVLLVGRTKIGKTAFKNLLIDPTRICETEKDFSPTQFPTFEQFSVQGSETIINLIDTPGLFQQKTTCSLPDNTTVLKLIENYLRSRTNHLHFVCFFVSISTLLVDEDLESFRQILDFFGPEIRKISCLIVTHSESTKENDRNRFLDQTHRTSNLKVLNSQMKQGSFFSGTINPDDWIESSNEIYKQFEQICSFRQKVLERFLGDDVKSVDLRSNTLAQKLHDQVESRKKKHPE